MLQRWEQVFSKKKARKQVKLSFAALAYLSSSSCSFPLHFRHTFSYLGTTRCLTLLDN